MLEGNSTWANLLKVCSIIWKSNDQIMPRSFANAFSRNIKTLNLKFFAHHEGIYIHSKIKP